MSIEVITVSSKGQVVLPLSMRKALAISEGAKLAAYASGGVIMLKPITMPTVEEFESFMDEAQEWASSVGYRESDVDEIVKSAREKKRT